jgi:hypothetical protein
MIQRRVSVEQKILGYRSRIVDPIGKLVGLGLSAIEGAGRTIMSVSPDVALAYSELWPIYRLVPH